MRNSKHTLAVIGLAVLAVSLATPAYAWEVPTPVVGPGDYKSKWFPVTFEAGNVTHASSDVSNTVKMAVLYQGREIWSETNDLNEDGYSLSLTASKSLMVGSYDYQVTQNIEFSPTAYPFSLDYGQWSCTYNITRAEPSSSGSGNWYLWGDASCTDAQTGTVYAGVMNEHWSPTATPSGTENAPEVKLTLQTPATWSGTKTVPFTVAAVNGPTVSYDEYSLIKKGMKRSKVERIFGNAAPVFYRKVKKGSLFIYDNHAYITYKNNKVTNTRWTF